MKLLVFGAGGQMALSLKDVSKASANTVFTAGRPDFDITNGGSVDKAISEVRPSCVINTAAYTAVDAAETDQEAAFACNEQGAANVARACQVHKLPLIHISTDYVYDGNKETPYLEDDAPSPTNAYGRSKLAGENAVRENCEQHVILRTAWLFSPFGKNFVKSMLRLAGSRTVLGVVDDQIGSPTYAIHLADGVLGIADQISAARAGADYWGIYHAAGSGFASWCDVARCIFREADRHALPAADVNAISSEEYPTAATRPMNSRLDCSKLSRVFGIGFPEWQHGVSDCVRRIALAG